MNSPLIQIKLNQDLLERIDKAAAANFQSRSAWIRSTLAMRLNDEHIAKNKSSEDEFDDMIKQFLPSERRKAFDL